MDWGCPVTNGSNRRVIHATCTLHGDARGFTNLVVTKKDSAIEFDTHAVGACVVKLDDDAARVLSDALCEWLA